MFPQSVLSKLYANGSMKNTTKGFEFNIKNVIDSGTLVELGPVTVNEKTYEAAALTVVTGNQERRADQVTRLAPLPVYIGSAFTIRVNGETLAAGEYAVSVSVLTREIGRLRIDFRDTVA